jgi:hypothetical protein
MQGNAPEPHTWATILASSVVAIVVAMLSNLDRIPKAIKARRLRREVARLEAAQEAKVLAEVETLKIGNFKSAGDFMLEWMSKVSNANVTIEQLRDELEKWKKEADKVPDLESTNKVLLEQNEEMKYQLKKRGLNYDGTPIEGNGM